MWLRVLLRCSCELQMQSAAQPRLCGQVPSPCLSHNRSECMCTGAIARSDALVSEQDECRLEVDRGVQAASSRCSVFVQASAETAS